MKKLFLENMKLMVRRLENSAGVRKLLCGEALNFLEFFGSFLFQDKNERAKMSILSPAYFYDKAMIHLYSTENFNIFARKI